MVQPSNLPDVVQEFITHLALEPDQLFCLEQNDPGKLFKSLTRLLLPLALLSSPSFILSDS